MGHVTLLAFVALSVLSTLNTQETEQTVTPRSRLPSPRCGPNESRLPCGKYCEDRCNGPRPRGCRRMECEDRGCRCNEGFLRNPYTNRCVRREGCPVDRCRRGEIAGFCGKTCEGTCQNQTEPEICREIFCVKRECRCDLQGGYVRNNSGQCVRKGRCETS